MDKQFKVFNSEIKGIDEDEGTLTALISTGAKDRMGESLDPMGLNKKNFDKNPVVLFGHQYDQPPIGKALWVKKSVEGVTAKVKFAPTKFAQEIFELFKGGFMRAFSVGFIPNMEKIAEGDGKKQPRTTFLDWELLEFSAVPVPANPEAIALAVKQGILTDANLKSMMEKELKPLVEKIDKEAKEAETDITEELLAEIKILQDKSDLQERELNSLRYQLILKQKPAEETLSEMTVSDIKKIIKDIADGVIRKAQGNVT